MPLPENYKPRKGDQLRVTGTVVYDLNDGSKFLFLDIGDDHGDLGIPIEAMPVVCDVVHRQWRVGDQVRVANYTAEFGKVVMIDDDGDQIVIKQDPTSESPGSLIVYGSSELISAVPLPAEAAPYIEPAPAPTEC